MRHIALGKLYAVYDPVPHAKHVLPGFPPFSDSIGIGENGGFAEYLVVDARELVLVVSAGPRSPCRASVPSPLTRVPPCFPLQPDGLAPEVAALSTDSLITVYNALHNVAQVRPS